MVRLLTSAVGVLFVTAIASAQTTAITNADVVKMLRAGMSDDLIITAVRQAQAKNFDVSPAGLIKLKTDGVSDRVIATMLGGGGPSSSGPTPANTAEVVLKDGTEIHLRLVQTVSSESARVNDKIRFEVAEDVNVDGRLVIARGAEATGTVIEAQKKKSFGRSGKLNFTIDVVKAVDNQNIRLRSTKNAKGDESYGKAGVVTILAGPFGALVKGKDVTIQAGTDYPIYIDGDRQVRLASRQ